MNKRNFLRLSFLSLLAPALKQYGDIEIECDNCYAKNNVVYFCVSGAIVAYIDLSNGKSEPYWANGAKILCEKVDYKLNVPKVNVNIFGPLAPIDYNMLCYPPPKMILKFYGLVG